MLSTDSKNIDATKDKLEDNCNTLLNNSDSHSSIKSNSVPDDVEQEINQLLKDVPILQSSFEITDKIGSGTFSSVYAAKMKDAPLLKEQFALKHILPTSHPDRIETELRCLQEVGGCDNVMGVKACVRHNDNVIIVMPHFSHDRFQDYVQDTSSSELLQYMYNLLLALRRVHAANIIHRDVKPCNFLYNRKRKRYALVDFGLAQKVSDSESKTKNLSSALSNENKNSPKKRKLSENDKFESPCKKVNSITNEEDRLSQTCDAPKLSIDLFSSSLKTKSPRRFLLEKKMHNYSHNSAQRLFHKDHVGGLVKRPMVVNSGNKSMYKVVTPASCRCFGKPMICSLCMCRINQVAPRAGTPGFRAPEVLMKCPHQTTAVDIWSAGIIFLSLLSGRYPFFKANDDLTALGQMIYIFGTKSMQDSALSYGKHLISRPDVEAVDLKDICLKLRGSSDLAKQFFSDLSDDAFDLLSKLLDLDPSKRISADAAVKHSFFSSIYKL